MRGIFPRRYWHSKRATRWMNFGWGPTKRDIPYHESLLDAHNRRPIRRK